MFPPNITCSLWAPDEDVLIFVEKMIFVERMMYMEKMIESAQDESSSQASYPTFSQLLLLS